MSCDGYVAVSLFLNENSCKYAILRDEFPFSVATPCSPKIMLIMFLLKISKSNNLHKTLI